MKKKNFNNNLNGKSHWVLILLFSVFSSNFASATTKLKDVQACTNCVGNKVLNPSFDNDLNNWTGSNTAAIYTGTGYASCGSINAFINKNGSATSSTTFNTIYQDIPVNTTASNSVKSGSTINFSIDGGVHNPNSNATFHVEFRNTAGVVSTITAQQVDFDVDIVATNTLQKYSFSGVVPSNATYIRIIGQTNSDYLKVDNACLTETPCLNPTPTVTITNPTCQLTTGGLTINGVAGMTYSIDGGPFASTLSITNLAPGSTHSVVAKNASGCTSEVASVTIGPLATNCNCTATISGIKIRDLGLATSGIVSTAAQGFIISNGGMYNMNDLPASFNLEALVSGNNKSVKIEFTGAQTVSKVENVEPWEGPIGSDGAWVAVEGTYTVNITAYSLDGAAGSSCATATFTFTLYKPASLGDYAWYDLNQNGIQDNRMDKITVLGPELPASGIKVELHKSSDGLLVGTKTTDSNGKYLFENLIPDNYYIKFNPTSYPNASFVITNTDVLGNDAIDSDIAKVTLRSVDTNLESGEVDLTWDLGLYSNSVPEISDPCGCEEKFIYTLPAQSNYLYTETVTVKATPGGVWRVIANNPATGATTVGVLQDPPSIGFNPTDNDPIGDLMIEVSPGVYEYKFYHFEQSSSADNYQLVVSNGINILDIKAKCSSIKEKFDNNLNDICAFASPIVLQTTFDTGTAEYYFIQNSAFEFTSGFDENTLIEAAKGNPIVQLNPADYFPGSTVALYIKWLPTSNGQPGTSCPKTLVINVTMGLDATKCLASIGDYVWEDVNKNGIQDANDKPLAGITVTLLNKNIVPVTQNAIGNTINQIVTTDNGLYKFTGLIPGEYIVQFSASPTLTRVISPSNADDALDSDAYATGLTSNYVLASGNDNITVDAGFVSSSPLPVTLVSFTGKATNKVINLTWKTSNEKNFSHFEIEKSVDLKEFGSIGKTNANNLGIYNFQDNTNLSSVNFYRLKIVDLDGSFNYSKIINVSFNENNNFISVENPAQNGEFLINTNINNPKIIVKSAIGSDVNFTNSKVDANQIRIKVSNYNPGIYFAIIEDENGNITCKKILIY